MDTGPLIDAGGEILQRIAPFGGYVLRQYGKPSRFPLAQATVRPSSAGKPQRALKIIEKSEQN
jgi:hypothetical protein